MSFCNEIKTKLDLINRIQSLQEEMITCPDKSYTLAKNIEYLSGCVYRCGIVIDPLTEQKYFISPGQLKGGGPAYSKNINDNQNKIDENTRNLSNKDDDLESVKKALKYFLSNRIANRQSLVVIQNKCKYDLHYRNHGKSSGFFFTDVQSAFINDVLPAYKGVGGFLSTKQQGTACGASGYFSFQVKTERRNYIVCCGFNTSYSGTNSAGVEIRAEDGNTDEKGCIGGHGFDPTGVVRDVQSLMTKCRHTTKNNEWHVFYEEIRCFKIKVSFQNKSHSWFFFEILDN